MNSFFIRRKRQLLITCGISIIFLAAWMERDFALHQYYSWRMKQSWSEVSKKDSAGGFNWWDTAKYPQGGKKLKQFQQYEFYRDKLVQRGWLKKETFVLRYISVPSDDSKRLWVLLTRAFPGNITVTMTGYETNSQDCIIVWDAPDQLDKWSRIISYYDKTNAQELLEAASQAK